jgi:hypothetical protein
MSFESISGEVTRVAYPVLSEYYHTLVDSFTDGVRDVL